ncbi:acetyltransferase [Bacillus cereus]|nr:acetyltransferase [Bacillus cereus]
MGEESLTKLFRIDCGDLYLQEFTVNDAESIYPNTFQLKA